MSDPYTDQIERIKKAASLDDIQTVARQFSAKATGDGGVLYSRPVGNVSSETIALELAAKTGQPIINNTPRAQFLADPAVTQAIRESAERIFVGQGQNLAQAQASASNFLFGDPKAVAKSATSLEGSLWGEASHEFAGSLRGDVKVVASNANVERVFGKVELPAVLENPNVRTLGGQPVGELKTLYAQGGADAVLPKVQAQFIEAAPKGIFVAAESTGPSVTKVAISREAAAALGADAAKFTPAAELTAAGLARAPTGLAATAAAPALGEGALAGEAAAARGGLRPGMATKGLTAVAVAALAYDFATTGHQVLQLQAQGNGAGAESAKAHFIGRNVGGIGGGIAGGFVAGAGYGLVAGSETGPGALVTGLAGGVIGGVGGAFLGEKWAKQKDIDLVFTQQDKDGNKWSRDPKDASGTWTRVAETQQVRADKDAAPVFGKVRYVAGDLLANELNYKAANASYELGLANLPPPQNPYSIAPGKGDARSLDGAGNWTRDPQTHAWSRSVVDGYIEHGMKTSHTETASPRRAAELDQASTLIIAQNAANGPAALAGRYQVAYEQFGWNRNGEPSPAIKDAATRTESLRASDGSTYTRGANGEWSTPGTFYGTNPAVGNVRDELNATYQSQRAGLQELAAVAAEARAHPTLPKPTTMRDMVASAYAGAGVPRTEAQIDAAAAAVARTHAREGLDRGGHPYSLTLQPDPKTGRPGPGSAIVTLMDDGRDGVFTSSKMVPRATTSADEIRQAEKATPTAPLPAKDAASLREPDKALGQLPETDRTLFARIRGDAPASVSDDHVMLAMRRAKENGIAEPGQLRGATVAGDTLWVAGNTPGFRASVNVAEPAPPAQETAQRTLAFNQQREQQQAADAMQREQPQVNRGGPVV